MMKLQTSPKLAIVAKALFYCGIAALTALLASGLENFNPFAPNPPQLTAEELVRGDGFNFSRLMEEETWAGPKVGDRVDFSGLRSRDDQSLSEALRERELSMLVVVAPVCQSCARSTGYMQKVRDEMARRGAGYYVVTFARREQPEALFDYADSLNLGGRSFRWDYDKFATPAAFDKIIVPAHLLVDRNQVVRGVWPGTSLNPAITDKMVAQIRADVERVIAGG